MAVRNSQNSRTPLALVASVSDAQLYGLYAVTLFVSALLLFSVQPMFAKMALPKLGGAPAVWAVSMCFFQAALLAGYCYAFALNRWLKPAQAISTHLAVLALAAAALPIGLPSTMGEPPEGDAYLWLTGLLALGVGLPFFAVSANAPLLQAWFSRTGHPAGKDPYFLYGASNVGSLLALIAYPLAIEPWMGLAMQSHNWSLGFMALALLIGACGVLMVSRADATPRAVAAAPRFHKSVTNTQRALWLLLALVPSGLLVASTTHIATDIASAPFIWVIPLALFLVTFILTFREHAAISEPTSSLALLVSILSIPLMPGRLGNMLAVLAASFFAGLICHRELFKRRPSAEYLTEFYVIMSAGGVLGGIFAALIAPQIFSSVAEFPLLLAAAAFCRPGVLFDKPKSLPWPRIGIMASVTLALCMLLTYAPLEVKTLRAITAVAPMGVAALYIATRARADHAVLMTLAALLLMMGGKNTNQLVHIDRSFFGTLRVFDDANGHVRFMQHGTTIHGLRHLRNTDGSLVAAPMPATYYHPHSPMARGVHLARLISGGANAKLIVGIVGLGTGSLACYANQGDAWRFYEIDPSVVRMAEDPNLFGYLPRCLPQQRVVVGDARLTLAHEPKQSFDYLVIDAFSSDAVPAHLLTREALNLYFDKLAPKGLLALHLSNRYLDLAPAVAATAATVPGARAILADWKPTAAHTDGLPSIVMFLTRDASVEALALKMPDAGKVEHAGVTAWTDDYSDMLSALARKLAK